MKKGFTLIELVVAIALLAMVLYSASKIFRVSIEAHRMATANAEIMQKLRAITDQLNADFKGLRKDGEIFVAWGRLWALDYDYDNDGYVRFDLIMFFADGDFQSYDQWPKDDPDAKTVRGNVARICYMLAKDGAGTPALWQEKPAERILARTQHILTADRELDDFLDPGTLPNDQLNMWHNLNEYDKISLSGWKNMALMSKAAALSVITDLIFTIPDIGEIGEGGGATIDPANPDSIHMLLCEGVGEFEVQGWYAKQQRWVPEVDADDLFPLPAGPTDILPFASLFYPYGWVDLGGVFAEDPLHVYPTTLVNEAHFNEIPGLGRALKFTFTLYDSKGILKNGRTFTHIVYIGN